MCGEHNKKHLRNRACSWHAWVKNLMKIIVEGSERRLRCVWEHNYTVNQINDLMIATGLLWMVTGGGGVGQ
jgi:hypothetical protein